MPAVPEIGDGSGEIRAFEILVQMYAEALGSAHDHVHTSGEITVELYGIAQHRRDHGKSRVGFVVAEHLIHQHGGPVGDDDLFKISPNHQQKTALQGSQVEAVFFIKLGG